MAFNRTIVGLFALIWIGVLVLAGWLIWDQARVLTLNEMGIDFRFDIVADQRSEQILGTIILAVLALPPLALLLAAMRPQRRDAVPVEPVESQTHLAIANGERLARLEERIVGMDRRLEQVQGIEQRIEAVHRETQAGGTEERERVASIESRIMDIERRLAGERELVADSH